jgi:phage gpG-like protein
MVRCHTINYVAMQWDLKESIKKGLADIQKELTEEFDQNFVRKAFFTEAWKRKRFDDGKELMLDSGQLRRSIKSELTDKSLEFYSSLIYAGIHNDGGVIIVTERMKKYFWRKYYTTSSRVAVTKSGTASRSKRNIALSREAEFYKYMALKKTGSKIVIPKRQFIGPHIRTDEIIKTAILARLDEYFNNNNLLQK